MRRLIVLAALIAVVLATVSASSSTQAATQGRWVITDLGALGGPNSTAVAINDRGQIVGWADTKAKDEDGDPLSHAFLWEMEKMRDLGTLGGKRADSEAVAINERGQIVGTSETEATDARGDPLRHAVLWQDGMPIDLGTMGGPESWETSDINESGQVVGSAESNAKDEDGDPLSHAFLWQKGKMRDLGTLGGKESSADAINERGQVVGSRYTKKAYKERAFLWQKGKMRDLGTLGGPESGPSGDILMELTSTGIAALNDRGQVVGWANTKKKDEDGDPISHAFLWQNGKMRDLGALGGRDSQAIAINQRGQVVGVAETKVNDPFWGHLQHAFLWEKGKMRDLGTLGGVWSEAVAINDRGQVVGRSRTKSGAIHAFLWQGGKMIDLGTLRGLTPYELDINEQGQIVGATGDPQEERYRAVLWTYKP